LPTNVVFRTLERTVAWWRTEKAHKAAKKPVEKAADIAYWFQIMPDHVHSRTWRQKGKVVGYYPNGIGPPSNDALFVVVVTAQPSRLEFPLPFGDSEEQDCIACGVLGRVPVLMTDAVLQRFYQGGVPRELFWTEDGVDFEDDTHKIDYSTAKFIGDALFDASRFRPNGSLRKDFQGVRALPVFVSYRAVSWSYRTAFQDNVAGIILLLHNEFATKKQLLAVAVFALLLFMVCMGWHPASSAGIPVPPTAPVQAPLPENQVVVPTNFLRVVPASQPTTRLYSKPVTVPVTLQTTSLRHLKNSKVPTRIQWLQLVEQAVWARVLGGMGKSNEVKEMVHKTVPRSISDSNATVAKVSDHASQTMVQENFSHAHDAVRPMTAYVLYQQYRQDLQTQYIQQLEQQQCKLLLAELQRIVKQSEHIVFQDGMLKSI